MAHPACSHVVKMVFVSVNGSLLQFTILDLLRIGEFKLYKPYPKPPPSQLRVRIHPIRGEGFYISTSENPNYVVFIENGKIFVHSIYHQDTETERNMTQLEIKTAQARGFHIKI